MFEFSKKLGAAQCHIRCHALDGVIHVFEVVFNAWLAELETSVKINLKDVNYSVERMASDMALSRTQLFRKLKHLTGLSPQYYLQEVRLQHALYLLETQQVDAVKAACYAVGFIKVKHFSQIFQERFGKLPSTYLS